MINNRKIDIGQYVHITNRGVLQRDMFHSQYDFARFLSSMFLSQYGNKLKNGITSSRTALNLLNGYELAGKVDLMDDFLLQSVEINAFCLMDTHFHILLRNLIENEASIFMKRLKSSYALYYNNMHKIVGHKFDSRFKSKVINSQQHLLNTINYIHRNPLDIPEWQDKTKNLYEYPYSSMYDYEVNNRWQEHLIIIDKKIIF